jgi:hypothetical protein
MSYSHQLAIALIIATAFTASCRLGTEPEPQILDALVYVSGDGQTGPPNTALPNPLVVQMNDRQGRAVAGVRISWVVEIGNGTVSPPQTLTDRQGLARANWTLGAPGVHGVMAFVDEPGAFGMEVFFGATAIVP